MNVTIHYPHACTSRRNASVGSLPCQLVVCMSLRRQTTITRRTRQCGTTSLIWSLQISIVRLSPLSTIWCRLSKTYISQPVSPFLLSSLPLFTTTTTKPNPPKPISFIMSDTGRQNISDKVGSAVKVRFPSFAVWEHRAHRLL